MALYLDGWGSYFNEFYLKYFLTHNKQIDYRDSHGRPVGKQEEELEGSDEDEEELKYRLNK